MQILAFESSAKAASVALLRDGALVAESYLNCGLTHSRTLTQLGQNLLETCEQTVQDLDAVACAAGPGSFTGVRIGVAAAKGLAWGAELPCYGVSTLEAMARTVASPQKVVCAVMDARRGQVYNALFSKEAALQRLTEDRAIAMEELAQELVQYEGTKYLIGDGAALCYEMLKNQIPGLHLPPEPYRHQRASGVALAAEALALAGVPATAAELVPNYLRLSQAERERLARLQQEKGANK